MSLLASIIEHWHLAVVVTLVLFVLWFSFKGSKAASHKTSASPSATSTARSRRARASAHTGQTWVEDELSGSWLSCCTSRQGDGKRIGLPSMRSDAKEAHVKYCGLRRLDPSAPAPACYPFPTKPWSPPEEWAKQIDMTEEERLKCNKLKAILETEPGTRDPITLIRYLRARQGDVNRAAAMYRGVLKFDDETGWIHGFRDGTIDDSLHRRLDKYWKPLGIIGWDRDGDPVVWEKLGKVHMASMGRVPVEFVRRHEIYANVRVQQAMDEQTIRLNRPMLYWTVIEDLDGLGLSHFNIAGLNKYKQCVRIDQDYFPEILKRVLIIRAPWIFDKIWAIVKHFFDEGTRRKIDIKGNANTLEAIRHVIDNKWIPAHIGGAMHAGGPECPDIITPGGEVPQELIDEIRQYVDAGGMQARGS